jgi:hypothetical protein
VRARLAARFWLPIVSGAYAALLVVLRGRPSLEWDTGVFLSVAGRLLHGDRLYVDVLDNKDPLFYYSDAAALAVGGWKAPFLLDVVWLAIAAVSAVSLLRATRANKLTIAAGFIILPLLLTGTWYLAGYSMLPALALAPLIAWLWITDRPFLAGVLVCVGLLFKANLALVLVSGPLAFLALRRPAGPIGPQLGRSAVGFGAAAAVAVLLLVLRGELYGYVRNLIDNVGYAGDVLAAIGAPTGIGGHIHQVSITVGEGWRFPAVVTAFAAAGVLAVWTLAISRRHHAHRDASAMTILAALFLSSLAMTAVTLALTGVWFHHSQALAYPVFLFASFVAAVITEESAAMPRAVAVCAGIVMAAALYGAATSRPAASESISSWFEGAPNDTAGVLERAADDRLPGSHRVTFAHLGKNDEQGVAAFLDQRFTLACPELIQFEFTTDLAAMLRCIRDETPALVLVTPSFEPSSSSPESWNRFVMSGESLLGHKYELSLQTEDGSAQVWALRPSPTP